jgi:hypothetical protein
MERTAKRGRGSVQGRGGKPMSSEKAKTMLRDNSAQGHPLTKKQKGLFGLIAGGGTPGRAGKK